jgi:outer membrane receptor protein involved in Fe transport
VPDPVARLRLPLTLAAVALILGLELPPRPAHGDPPPDAETVEVVGTRDVPDNRTSGTPVTILDAAAIARSSATTIDQLLGELPDLGFQGVNGSQNDGGYGAAFADLRNLNFNRTLVLVNGRRFVLTGIKTDEAVDLTSIPVSLIDHVEILRDGSEPKYGADAVAGVINIVLKQHVDGNALSAMGGLAGQGDARTGDLSETYGHEFAHGNVAVNLGWTHRDALPQSDRSWARDPITAAAFGSNGRIEPQRGDVATLGGHATAPDGLDALVSGPGQARAFDPGRDGYDFSTAQYLQGGLDKLGLTALGHYDFADDLTAFAELLYAHRRSTTELPPQDLGVAGTAKHPDAFLVPADAPGNFFGEDVTLARVLGEVGPQRTTTGVDTIRIVTGLDGMLPGNTDWTLSFNHGQTDQSYRTSNAVNLTRALETVGADPAGCAAAAGCVPADYFGPGALAPAAANYIRYTDVATSHYQEDIAALTVSRPLLTLPAGAWVGTLAAEYRAEHGATTPSPVTLAGDQAASDSAATSGGYSSREASLDLDLPLLGDLPFIRSLTAEASARYAGYDRFGSFPVWKAALSWSPTADLRLRASTGVARRVPAITEAFGGSTASFLTVQDPCDAKSGKLADPAVAANCRAIGLAPGFTQASPLINVANGGNPNLVPEASRNQSAGIVLTPRPLPGLTLSVDYYRIKIGNAIDSYADTDPNFIPDSCYESVALSSPFCRAVIRAPSGQINLISAPDENIGAIKTDGLDIDLADRLPLGRFGGLSLDWQNTLLLNYRVKQTAQSGFVQYAGTFPSLVAVGSYPRFKSRLAATLERDAWSFGWTTRYIGGATVLGSDPATTPYSSAPGVFYHDAEAAWHLGATTLTLGIDNLLDRKPPLLVDGASNTNRNTYDVLGRFFYAKAAVSF